MIIECKACHARFRLDESKIKGRGARVKCRKCGEQIVVLKEAGSAPPPESGAREGTLDLGSALRETPPDNLIHFPKTPVRPAEPTETAGKDEVDLAFEQLLERSGAPEEPKFEPPAEVPGFEPPAELSFEPPPEEPKFEPPAEEPVVEPSAEFTFESPAEAAADAEKGFAPDAAQEPPPFDLATEVEGAVPSLKEEEPPPDFGKDADISLAIGPAPSGAEPDLPLESSAFTESKEAFPPPPPEEIAVEGNATPPAAAREAEVPPFREEEPAEPAAQELPPEPAEPPAAPSPARAPAGRIALLALVVALFGAAGYLGFTESGRRLLGSVSPRLAAFVGGGAAKTASRYEVKNVIGYYDSGVASGKILVIKGQVTNLASVPKSGIRIVASLLDNTGKVLTEQAVYAGNLLPGATLKSESRADLEKTLANPLGEHLMNMDVPAGKTIPFMVLFFDAPEEIDSYKLEAKDAQ